MAFLGVQPSNGRGQLYGGAGNTLQVAAPVKQATTSSGNFTQTANPQTGIPLQFSPAGGSGGGGSSQATSNPGPSAQQIADQQAAAAQQAQQSSLAAQYEDQANQLQTQLGYADNQLNNGRTTINNSYNQSNQDLTDQLTQAQHQYDTTKQQNTQNYASTRNNALTQTRANGNALQRLLGMNGAGNSSAAYELAPYAAALQGTQVVNGAQRTYGQNAANADNGWNQTQLTAKQAKTKLDQSKTDNLNKLQQNVANSKATLLDKIRAANINAQMARGTGYGQAAASQADTQNQINTLLAQIQSLGTVQPLSVEPGTINYNTPEMSQYQLGNISGPTQQTDPGTSDVNPSFLSLLSGNQKRDQYGQLINQ